MAAPNPYAQYKNTEVKTASPAQLVVLLYEGAVKHILKGQACMEEPEKFTEASTHLLRAINIVTELLGILNPEASQELAGNLSGIYQYIIELISDALKERDPKPLSEAVKLLSSLTEAWREVAQSPA